MSFATCDLCDDFDGKPEYGLRVVEPMFRIYGGAPAFAGPIATLKVFEDNSLVRERLGEPGEGRVLVIDGGGSRRRNGGGGRLRRSRRTSGRQRRR